MVDAIIIKAQEGGQTRSKAIFIAIGFYDEGQREILILAMMVGDGESMESWKEFFT